jgi:hypothetical protein
MDRMSSPPNTQFLNALARGRVEIFSSVWLEAIDIMRASIRMPLAVALRESFLKSPSQIKDTQWAQWWYEFFGQLAVVHPKSIQNTELRLITSIYV